MLLFMPANADVSKTILQLKVTLEGCRPAIWRRLLVPASLSLGDLHAILQSCMEWQDSHLHQFQVDDVFYGPPNMDSETEGVEFENESRALLHQVLPTVGSAVVYEYDFGDSWEHSVVVEQILPASDGQKRPVCTAGARCAPPEDCGGVWGYESLLEALADPDHEDHDEMVEFYGDDFDPERFDLNRINRRLARVRLGAAKG